MGDHERIKELTAEFREIDKRCKAIRPELFGLLRGVYKSEDPNDVKFAKELMARDDEHSQYKIHRGYAGDLTSAQLGKLAD